MKRNYDKQQRKTILHNNEKRQLKTMNSNN